MVFGLAGILHSQAAQAVPHALVGIFLSSQYCSLPVVSSRHCWSLSLRVHKIGRKMEVGPGNPSKVLLLLLLLLLLSRAIGVPQMHQNCTMGFLLPPVRERESGTVTPGPI